MRLAASWAHLRASWQILERLGRILERLEAPLNPLKTPSYRHVLAIAGHAGFDPPKDGAN